MSVMRQLRESGLFQEKKKQDSTGTIRFVVNGYSDATIFAHKNDREFHIRKDAFRNERFPNNGRLCVFAFDHARNTEYHGRGNPAESLQIDGVYIAEAIGIINVGR